MAAIMVFLSVVALIAIMLYFAHNLNPQLDFMKWLLVLLVIPMMAALASVAVDNSKDCALIYDDNTQTLSKVCTGDTSLVALWLLKITTWLMYVEVILMIIGIFVIAYQAAVRKGGHI